MPENVQENETEKMVFLGESWGQNCSFSSEKLAIILNYGQSTQLTDNNYISFFVSYIFRSICSSSERLIWMCSKARRTQGIRRISNWYLLYFLVILSRIFMHAIILLSGNYKLRIILMISSCVGYSFHYRVALGYVCLILNAQYNLGRTLSMNLHKTREQQVSKYSNCWNASKI